MTNSEIRILARNEVEIFLGWMMVEITDRSLIRLGHTPTRKILRNIMQRCYIKGLRKGLEYDRDGLGNIRVN